MKNLLLEVDFVINNEADEDVWIVYKSEEELDKYYSLSQLLFDIDFDP